MSKPSVPHPDDRPQRSIGRPRRRAPQPPAPPLSGEAWLRQQLAQTFPHGASFPRPRRLRRRGLRFRDGRYGAHWATILHQALDEMVKGARHNGPRACGDLEMLVIYGYDHYVVMPSLRYKLTLARRRSK